VLFHYTCSHSQTQLGAEGILVPGATLSARAAQFPQCHYVWLTDMAVPARGPLGLTGNFCQCDRTEFRYLVTDDSMAVPWVSVRRQHSWAVALESAEGARPRHWWVSTEPVPVILA
jgi:hypothetical protein